MSIVQTKKTEEMLRDLAAQVKRDTIEACAKIAEDYDGLGMACGPNEQSGHAEITKDDIAKAIRGLARG